MRPRPERCGSVAARRQRIGHSVTAAIRLYEALSGMRKSVGVTGRWAVLAAALALSGCDTLSEALGFSDDNTLELGPTCPRVAVGDDVGYVARYDGNGTSDQNLLYAVKMEVPNGVCYLNETSIDVEMSVPIFVKRGPAMESREVNFEYWIAVTRIDKT